jgi:ABC-2 type transport system ATP-binding protein
MRDADRNSASSEAAPGAAPIVVAEALAKRYGPVVALEDLSLEIRRGEVFGLLGPNGSGKTTFIRILAGYLAPTRGKLLVAGLDVVHDALQARRRLGYVPEAAPLYGHMQVLEFLDFMGRLRGLSSADLKRAIERVVERLSLGDVLRKPTRALSRGYRQRVAIAQALIHDPEIIVLDEPTNGLDPRQIIEVRELVRSLAGTHTVIMSSHILTEVGRVADRVAILLDGKLRGVRTLAETPDLEDWFLSLA